MQVHSQFTIKCHAENLGGGRRFNTVFTDCHGLCVDLYQLMSGSKPQEWSLVGVQLQPIRLHPTLDSFNAFGQSKNRNRFGRWEGNRGKVGYRRHRSELQHQVMRQWIWHHSRMKRSGPKTEPCGTPYFSWIRADWWPLKVTGCCRP